VVCGLFITIPGVLRASAAGGEGEWDLDVRKQVVLRLDAIAYGIALAWWHKRRPSWFAGGRVRISLGVVAAVGIVVCWVYYHRHIGLFPPRPDWINATLFFPGVTWVSCCLTALAIPLESGRGGQLDRLVRFFSVTSYSVYLLHLQVFVLTSKQVSTPASAWGWWAAALAVLLLFGSALHRWVEKPFMEMRRRFDPDERVTPHLVARS
jgi:peptidoglycan/LPS O-acetylase OafA/YrhL